MVILPWIIVIAVLLTVALLVWWIVHTARVRVTSKLNPVGVRGWLLFLVVMLCALSPLRTISSSISEMSSAESSFPELVNIDSWRTFKLVSGIAVSIICALSVYAGYSLATHRKKSVVRNVTRLLWIIGPFGVIVTSSVIPLMMFGNPNWGAQFLGALAGQIIAAAVWSAYLRKSERVKATYTEPSDGKTDA